MTNTHATGADSTPDAADRSPVGGTQADEPEIQQRWSFSNWWVTTGTARP